MTSVLPFPLSTFSMPSSSLTLQQFNMDKYFKWWILAKLDNKFSFCWLGFGKLTISGLWDMEFCNRCQFPPRDQNFWLLFCKRSDFDSIVTVMISQYLGFTPLFLIVKKMLPKFCLFSYSKSECLKSKYYAWWMSECKGGKLAVISKSYFIIPKKQKYGNDS